MSMASIAEAEKRRIEAMSKPELRQEMIETLVGSLMPLIECVVKKRVSQWFDVISGAAIETKSEPEGIV